MKAASTVLELTVRDLHFSPVNFSAPSCYPRLCFTKENSDFKSQLKSEPGEVKPDRLIRSHGSSRREAQSFSSTGPQQPSLSAAAARLPRFTSRELRATEF